MTEIARTGAGLRDALFEQLERLRDRKTTPEEAAAFAKISSEIIKSAQMQLHFEQLRLDNKIAGTMGDMALVPPLTQIENKNAKDAKARKP